MKRKILTVLLAAALCVSLAVPAFAAEPETIQSITVNLGIDEFSDLNITLTNFNSTFERAGFKYVSISTSDLASTVSFSRDTEIVFGSGDESQTKLVNAGDVLKISDYSKEIPAENFRHAFGVVIRDENEDKLILASIDFFVADKSFAEQYYSSEFDGYRMGLLEQLGDLSVDSGSVAPTPAPTAPKTQTVNPTASTVYLNGEAKAFEAYNIGGNNYFKLRDLAYVLSGTEKQFEVGYDNATKAIALTSGQPYTAQGGEMTVGDGQPKTAAPTPSQIYLDGKELNLTVYNISGNNFFKLRDLMKAVDVYVGYDNATKAITLDTSEGYVEE